VKTRPSISIRLTLWFSGIFLAGFIVFGLVMWFDLAYSLSQGRDRTLSHRAARGADLLNQTIRDSPDHRAARFDEFSEGTPEGNLIHFLDAHGKRFYPALPSPNDFPWPAIPPTPKQRFSIASYHGVDYRVLQFPASALGKTVWIFIGGQLEDNRHLLARFSTGLSAAIPALLALSALCGYFLSRRALRPVDKVTAALRSISIGNLSERLPTVPTGDELHRLAETCNDMLSRLEAAVTRINRFTADASHELRSPVSLIRTVSEFALRNPRLPSEAREAFEDVLAESIQAAELLDDMLTLARADAGHMETAFEAIDLRDVLQEAGENIQPLADAKQQTLVLRSGDSAALLLGHRSSLRRLLWTLLDNAVKYTPVGGRIEAALQSSDTGPRVTVADTGIGIPEALLPRVFERFFRADPSRSQVEGAGLGLAIAKWIADMHHATLLVRSRENQGTEFTVVFPAR
jgi:heavy metal sensor kinase